MTDRDQELGMARGFGAPADYWKQHSKEELRKARTHAKLVVETIACSCATLPDQPDGTCLHCKAAQMVRRGFIGAYNACEVPEEKD